MSKGLIHSIGVLADSSLGSLDSKMRELKHYHEQQDVLLKCVLDYFAHTLKQDFLL